MKLTPSLGEIMEIHPFAQSGLTPAVGGLASVSTTSLLSGAAQGAERHSRGPSHALPRLQLHTYRAALLLRDSSSQQLQIRGRFIL